MSNGKDRWQPTWHQLRDKRVPSPPYRAMHLTQRNCNQSAITPSALGSDLPSHRWIHSMAQSLLCSCVFSSTNAMCTMQPSKQLHSFVRLRPSFPTICALHNCSLASLTFSLCLLALASPQSCWDNEGNPNATQLSNQIDRAWLLVPRLHPPIVHHPPRQPPRCSLATTLAVFHPSLHPMHARSNGLISWAILWVSTQVQFQTWPPLRNELQSPLPIPLRFRPMIVRQSTHPLPKLRVNASMPTRDINRLNLTPAQTVPPTGNYKKALQSCKAWCLKCERIWTTSVFVWKSWMGRGHNSCKCSQLCRNHATPQTQSHLHQELNDRSWYHLRTKDSGGGRSTRYSSDAQRHLSRCVATLQPHNLSNIGVSLHGQLDV
jgi:hypothetical protein